MKKKIYILKNFFSKGEVILEYNKENFLKSISFSNDIDEKYYLWIKKNMPYKEKIIKLWKNKSYNIFIKKVPFDLSFNFFWKSYNYKVGKIKMAENIWEKMSLFEKIKAISYIPKYFDHIKKTGHKKAYPTTYLSQKYFFL